MKRRRCALLTAVCLAIPFISLSGAKAVEALENPRPTLRKIVPYTLADMNHDVAGKRMEELTGYTVEYEVMPQDDPTPKLLFQIATGAEYDIIKCTVEQFIALKSQGALVDLAPYVEAYGSYLAPDQNALSKELIMGPEGELYGLPLLNNPTLENPYGVLRNGLAFREDVLAELSIPVPKTLDELTDCLIQIREHKGAAPLTIAAGTSTVWASPILSAFGLGETEWYLKNDAYVPRIRMPGTLEYLAYMQRLYREGLLDAEFPINRTENTIDKMASHRAYVTTMYFWDIPTLKDAFDAGGISGGIEMAGALQRDAATPADYYVDYGLYYVFCIPKSSRHVADAVYYMNLQSAPETFLFTYLGKEGEQYQVVDGQYFPLFPGFESYLNAAQYTALSPDGNEFVYWQARARKTPEMSKAYDQMNSTIGELILHADQSSYGFGQPGAEVRAALNQRMGEMLLEAIVADTPPEAAIAEMIAVWEAEGGLAFEAAMNRWYQENRQSEAFLNP